jgi:hypothetical protein
MVWPVGTRSIADGAGAAAMLLLLLLAIRELDVLLPVDAAVNSRMDMPSSGRA